MKRIITVALAAIITVPALAQEQNNPEFNQYKYVPWSDALGGQTIRWKRWFKNDQDMFRQLKERYEAINPSKLEAQEETIIPKKIHQIWIGSAVPKKYAKLSKTWQEVHPDWEYRLWTDEDVPNIEMQNRDLFEKAKNIGQKADILRLEILNQFGGLYVDMDFECVHPFDQLNHTYTFYTGLNHCRIFELANGLIACTKGHPLTQQLIDNISLDGNERGWRQNVVVTTGPAYFTGEFMKYVNQEPEDLVMAFPTTYFYPMRSLQRFKWETRMNFLKPESFAIHYFDHNWWKQR